MATALGQEQERCRELRNLISGNNWFAFSAYSKKGKKARFARLSFSVSLWE